MKVVVDELRCDAHGVCVDACPEVFALSDDDLSHVPTFGALVDLIAERT